MGFVWIVMDVEGGCGNVDEVRCARGVIWNVACWGKPMGKL